MIKLAKMLFTVAIMFYIGGFFDPYYWIGALVAYVLACIAIDRKWEEK